VKAVGRKNRHSLKNKMQSLKTQNTVLILPTPIAGEGRQLRIRPRDEGLHRLNANYFLPPTPSPACLSAQTILFEDIAKNRNYVIIIVDQISIKSIFNPER
jgi:hypothetical protein